MWPKVRKFNKVHTHTHTQYLLLLFNFFFEKMCSLLEPIFHGFISKRRIEREMSRKRKENTHIADFYCVQYNKTGEYMWWTWLNQPRFIHLFIAFFLLLCQGKLKKKSVNVVLSFSLCLCCEKKRPQNMTNVNDSHIIFTVTSFTDCKIIVCKIPIA